MSTSTKHALQLHDARLTGQRIDPLTTSDPLLDIKRAYDVQWNGVQLRLHEGEHIIGAKLGLTSQAKQREVGFTSPIFSWLTSGMRHRSGHPLSLSNLRVPRVEPEIALILRRELGNDAETVASLYDAISFVAPSMEILDSRYHTNAPSLPDVISDGASAAGFVVGEPVPYDPSEDPDLEQIRCAFLINGSPVAGASATEALGGPVRALAALVEIVRGQGRRVPAGAIVMTGGLTRAFPINPGDLVAADFGPILGRVELPTTP